MIEASAKLKIVLLIDALLFFLCILGSISVSNKADLPFEISTHDSLLAIKIPDSNSYGLKNGDKLLSIDGISTSTVEKTEFIIDRKYIGDKILISVLTDAGQTGLTVKLTNYYSVFYLISTSIVAFLFFTIGVFVLLKKSDLKAAYIFHWASIGISLMVCLTWSNLNTFSFLSKYIFRALLHISYVITPALFVHFTLAFPTDNTTRWKNFIYFNYFIAFLLAALNIYYFTNALGIFNDKEINSYLLTFNFLRIYLIISVVLSISFFILALLKEKGKVERQQLKWLLFGFLIGPFSFVILWVLPILFTGKALVPEELIMILLCAIPMTFAIAIIKYHLLNIDEVLNRSIVYGIVIAILLLIYSALIILSVYLLDLPDQSLISAIAAVILALLFQPLKTKVQIFVDKKFFRINYNFRKELSRITENIKNYNDVNSLSEYLIKEIDSLFSVEKIAFSELDVKTGKLSIHTQKNFDQISDKILHIKPETLARKWFQVAAVKNKVEDGANISTIFQNTLVRWKISLIVPIKSVKDELFGFIILGSKKSGVKFSSEDVDFLKDIGINAGTTIERIKLQEQLIREKLAAEKLEELNQQKSMFVSQVSHELKTPLTSIKMFSEMLLQNEVSLTNKSKNHLEIIEGESDRLTRLINNVLDFSKIEKGVKEYSFREIHFNKIVRDVIEMMRYTIKMKGFNLKTNITHFDDVVCGDADALIQAIENLTSNAIRFSTENKEIALSTFREDIFACVSIKDSGIGIAQNDIDKIFDPFFRSEDAKLKKIDGTGLGLHIVKDIIEQHKGKIQIESLVGEGSNFTLCIPIISNKKGSSDEENFNN
ncbi:MAG TPA: hypothetical protein DHV28_11890 [Ignavibacteriales bacterium]|nr:hypothetical protein [Ignavibacteriales bacterium]